MIRHSARWLVTSLVAGAGASVMTLTSMINPGIASADGTALIMGGSGIPIPPPPYVEGAGALYIDPLHPGYTPQALFTPEGLYPFVGVKSLPLDTSVAQGVTILNNAINGQIASGNDVAVFGYSQSSTISSLEMRNLAALPAGQAPTADHLSFVLVGDPDAPNGGLLSRFPDNLMLPSLGATFYGPTPADTIYPTDIYSLEYDGFTDFPRYPINLLADINAELGLDYVHLNYLNLSPEQISGAIPLPTSEGYDGVTHYFEIPTQNLPLLAPLQQLAVPQAFLDLVQPDLKVLVNLGYGADNLGYSDTPADVETPFGLFPDVNPLTVLGDLVTGAQQGISQFVADLPSLPSELAAFLDPSTLVERAESVLESFAVGTAFTIAEGASPPENLTDALTNIVSTDYATLLPTADFATAFGTILSSYNATLFADALSSGDILGAFGNPIAADVGLASFLAYGEVTVLANALLENVFDLSNFTP